MLETNKHPRGVFQHCLGDYRWKRCFHSNTNTIVSLKALVLVNCPNTFVHDCRYRQFYTPIAETGSLGDFRRSQESASKIDYSVSLTLGSLWRGGRSIWTRKWPVTCISGHKWLQTTRLLENLSFLSSHLDPLIWTNVIHCYRAGSLIHQSIGHTSRRINSGRNANRDLPMIRAWCINENKDNKKSNNIYNNLAKPKSGAPVSNPRKQYTREPNE